MGRADELRERLERYCATELGRSVTVADLRRFSGGASRETWSFTVDGTPHVLRLDPPNRPSAAQGAEVELLRRAHAAGVPVPRVIWTPDAEAIGSSGYVMEHIDGETIARKIIRDDDFALARSRFAAQCGEIAAKIHGIDPDGIGLESPEQRPTELVLDQYATLLDTFGEPHPVFELALRWLRTTIPDEQPPTTVVHGDYRIGNFIVDGDGIAAVLDWELIHIGDPWEDLAWVCTRSWRFGGDGEVGGVGDREDLYAAYEATSGTEVDRAAVHWWEVMSSVKWGVMTIGQAFTHLFGHVRSLELAAIGRRTVECEHDVLDLLSQEVS